MVNTPEEEELEDFKIQEEERQLKHKNMLPAFGFFEKSTLAWLTVGLVIGSFVRGPWTQEMVEILRGYRWNSVER